MFKIQFSYEGEMMGLKKYRFIWMGISLGLIMWVLDALLHVLFFVPENTFFEYFIWDAQSHDIYFRMSFIFLSAGFGIVVQAMFVKQQKLHARLQNVNKIIDKHDSFFESIFHSIGDAAIIMDTEGRVLRLNPAAEELLCWRQYQAVGKALDEVFTLEETTEVAFLDRVIREVLKEGRVMHPFQDVVINNRLGARLYISDSISPIMGKHNTVIGCVLIFQDTTQKQKQEIELRKSEERFQRVLDIMPDMVSIQQPDLSVIYSNWNGFANIPKEERILGEKCHMLYRKSKDVCADCKAKEVLATKNTTMVVEQLPDGRWVDVRVIPLLDINGEVEYFMEWVRDVTISKTAEERLHASEQRFRTIIEDIPSIAVQGYDETRKVTFWNRASEALYGYSKEEALGNTLEDLIIPDKMREDVINGHKMWIDKDIPIPPGELILKNKDNQPVQVHSSHVMHDNGQTKEMFCLDVDLRPIKIAEHALKRSEERFHLAMNATHDGLFDWNLKDDSIYFSPAWKHMLGYEDDELPNRLRVWEELMHPEDLKLARSMIAELLDGKREQFNMEFRMRHKHDRWVTIVSRANVYFDSTGKPHRLIGTHVDISQRKEYEETLRKFRQAIEQSQVIVVITNLQGDIEYVNPSFEHITGYSSKEVFGKNPRILNAGRLPKSHYVKLWEKLINGETWQGEFCNKTKAGKIYWEDAIISPIRDEHDDISHFVAVKEDITQRKQLWDEVVAAKEKAEESDRLKSAFLANISHEIRTPMNGILGFAELLKKPKISAEKQKKFVDVIEQSGRRMLNIINDLIDISKIESGQMNYQASEVNVNEVITHLFTFFEPEARQKELFLSFETSLPDKYARVNTDGEKLYAVLTNLIKNAIKYTPRGSIRFGYLFKNTTLEFYVDDTGIGIPEDRLAAVFDRFVQADVEDRQGFEGAGLGLAISKAYVEMMGGRIWVDSKPNVGSMFCFTIPYDNKYEVKASEQGKHKSLKSKISSSMQDAVVLLVEDDEFTLTFFQEILEAWPITLKIAKTGMEALEIYKSLPDIDLVLMDLKLPGMSGLEVVRHIRAMSRHIPIVAQSAYAHQEMIDEALEAGCNRYLSKPIQINQLAEVLNAYLSGRPRHKQM